MSKKTDGWMPLYVADYLADTSRLTTEQHGAYMLIIMDYWRNGAPPDDDAVLASITKMAIPQWKKAAGSIRAFFAKVDGKLVHKRVEAERQKASGISTKRTDAAHKGAAKRWGKDMPNGMPNGMLEAMQSGWQNDAPSPYTNTLPNGNGGSEPSSDLDEQGLADACPHQKIIALYHQSLPNGIRVREWTPARAQSLRSRWRSKPERQNLDWWGRFFGYVAKSPFLTGDVQSQGRRPFELSLDWLCKSENFAKVIEGKYHGESQGVAA